MDMMVPQRAKEEPTISEWILIILPVKIQETKKNTEDIGSRYITVKLKKTLINQRQIPGQNWCADKSPSKIAE